MTKQPLGQGPVEAFYDCLIPMKVHSTTPHLYIGFGQQLIHSAHELTPQVNREQRGPCEWAAFVDAT